MTLQAVVLLVASVGVSIMGSVLLAGGRTRERDAGALDFIEHKLKMLERQVDALDIGARPAHPGAWGMDRLAGIDAKTGPQPPVGIVTHQEVLDTLPAEIRGTFA